MPAPNLEELGVQFTSNADGTVEYRLPSGSVYKGKQEDVIAEVMKSQIHASGQIRDLRTEKERAESELEKYRQQQQQVAQPPVNVDQQTKQLGDYLWDTLAKSQFGADATGQQLVAALNQQQASVNQQQTALKEIMVRSVNADFDLKCPDFPNTDEAGDAVVERVQRDFGLDPNQIDNLCVTNPNQALNLFIAAHRACVADNVYQPLSDEQIRAASDQQALEEQRSGRPTPPPLVRGGNPEQTSQVPDAWSMPLAELRAKAIRDQLEGK